MPLYADWMLMHPSVSHEELRDLSARERPGMVFYQRRVHFWQISASMMFSVSTKSWARPYNTAVPGQLCLGTIKVMDVSVPCDWPSMSHRAAFHPFEPDYHTMVQVPFVLC
jgi:hypothetical protein